MNREQEVILIAQIRAKQNKYIELKKELTILVKQTQAESGCQQFELHQAEREPHLFILWECFINQSAFELHMQQAYTKTYFELVKPKLTESTNSIRLNKV